MDLVTSRLVPFALWHLEGLGRSTHALRKAFALPEDVVSAGAVRLSLAQVDAFFEEASRLSGVAELGVVLAQAVGRGQYGMLEFALRSAGTLGEALEVTLRSLGLPGEPIAFDASFTAAGGELSQHVEGRAGGQGRHANVLSLAIVLRLAREISGQALVPRRVWWMHEAPASTEAMEAFFGTRAMSFGAGTNGFSFPAEWRALPVTSADATLHRVLATELAVQSRARPPVADATSASQVRRVLDDLMATPGTVCSLERVARRLGVSGRALQRQLAKEQASFRALLREVQLRFAEQYLGRSELEVGDVAERLGFSDGRSFARAFRAATGMAPEAYRKRL